METVIALENVYFSYGREYILEDVNMKVKPGEYVGIIGTNGAGKSTLIKIMLGELNVNEGKVFLMDNPINKFKSWGQVGYVPQVGFTNAANFPANVSEVVMSNLYSQVGLFRWHRKVHRDKVNDALEKVGMEKYKKSRLEELSGGQQQRIMIARALVSEPKLLLLDEPTTGIDQKSEENLYSLLEELNKDGIAIVIISHDYDKIAKYINRTYHIKNHKIHVDRTTIVCDQELEAIQWKTKK